MRLVGFLFFVDNQDMLTLQCVSPQVKTHLHNSIYALLDQSNLSFPLPELQFKRLQVIQASGETSSIEITRSVIQLTRFSRALVTLLATSNSIRFCAFKRALISFRHFESLPSFPSVFTLHSSLPHPLSSFLACLAC